MSGGFTTGCGPDLAPEHGDAAGTGTTGSTDTSPGTGAGGSGDSDDGESTTALGTDTETISDCGEAVQVSEGWCLHAYQLELPGFVPTRAFANERTSVHSALLWGDSSEQPTPFAWAQLTLSEGDTSAPTPNLEFFYYGNAAPTHGSELVPARYYTTSRDRDGFVLEDSNRFCSEFDAIPGPDRAGEVQPFVASVIGFEGCGGRPTQLAAIQLGMGPVDEYLLYDGENERLAIHTYDEPDSFWALSALSLRNTQHLPLEGCAGVSDLRTGDFDNDGEEEVAVLSFGCEDPGVLRVLERGAALALEWGPPVSAEFDFDVVGTSVARDVDADGVVDLVVAGEGQLGYFRGAVGGLASPVAIEGAPVPAPISVGGSPDAAPKPVYLGTGQFNKTAALELVVVTNAGLSIIPIDGSPPIEVGNAPGDFASVDLNADGISDLAVLGDGLTIYLSAPL